jgi:hypothetical protein
MPANQTHVDLIQNVEIKTTKQHVCARKEQLAIRQHVDMSA